MKKIYALASLMALASVGYSQSQRVQLFEEFTGENCAPCASTNPGLNAILHAPSNKGKIVAIKYQVPIPSAGPIYNAYKVPSDARRSFYGVNSAPNGRHDGELFAQSTNAPGHPGYFAQSNITARENIISPLDLDVTHTLSENGDSIYVHVEGKATMDFSGNLKLRIAVIENEITFDQAPGTNGEKVFEDVCREMLPNAAGTALGSSYADGDEFSYDFAWKIKHVYDISQIAIVSFVQDDANKNVLQAAKSDPVPVSLDAAVSDLNNVDLFQCTDKVSPSFTLTNKGVDAITTCEITYKIDNGTPEVFNWTGNLATDQTDQIELPEISVPAGSHSFVATVTKVNGATDISSSNNVLKAQLNILTESKDAPYAEAFSSNSFPANGFFIIDEDGKDGWEQATGAGGYSAAASEKAAKVLLYYTVGAIEELVMPKVDFSKLGSDKAAISFDYAMGGTPNNGQRSKLELMISNDCGSSWTTLKTITGADLHTGEASLQFYVPKVADWRTATVEIEGASTMTETLVKLVATGDRGNYLWVDNIDMNASTGIQSQDEVLTSINVYPNPASTNVNIKLSAKETANVSIEVVNMVGAVVASENVGTLNAGNHNLKVDLSTLSSGMYTVNVKANGSVSHHNISVVK